MVVCGGRGPACGTLPAGSVVPGVDAEDSDTLVSWKVGALYKPSHNGSLYANYAISEKPPGGARLELSSAAYIATTQACDPLEARTAKIGSKQKLTGNRLQATAAMYDHHVHTKTAPDQTHTQ